MSRIETIAEGITLYLGDCREILPSLDGVHAVVTDPPYAEIDRDYGRLTEPQWHILMDIVVSECRRMLGDAGSAVFILQANSERVGRMRPWLFEFQAKWARDWNLIQDAWWWNFATPPTVHCHREYGLMRPSMKACVWLGHENSFRNQSAVLLSAAEATVSDKRIDRHDLGYSPSGLSMRHGRALAAYQERGGTTPFNVVVCANSDSTGGSGAHGHGAGTPLQLASWWTRYLSKEGQTVLDPFMGAGTMGVAAHNHSRNFIGIEQSPKYFDIACKRIEEATRQFSLFTDAPTSSVPSPLGKGEA